MNVDPKTVRVLLVEDDPIDQTGVRRLFARITARKFELSAAVDLASAMALTEKDAGFDVILLDLGLPDSSGLDTVRRVVRALPTVPVVVLTGNDDADLAVDAVRLGAQDYLPKETADEAILYRILAHAIDRQSAMNDLRRRFAAWTTVTRALRALADGDELRKHRPDAFAELVTRYQGLLARTAHGPDASSHQQSALAELGRRLAECDGTAADVLEVHMAAIGRRVNAESHAGRSREDEQLLILEALGHLATAYRRSLHAARSSGSRELGG